MVCGLSFVLPPPGVGSWANAGGFAMGARSEEQSKYAFAKNEERNAGLEWETRGSFCLIEAYYFKPARRG